MGYNGLFSNPKGQWMADTVHCLRCRRPIIGRERFCPQCGKDQRMKGDRQQLHIRLPGNLYWELKQAADAEGASDNDLVCCLLKEALDRRKSPSTSSGQSGTN